MPAATCFPSVILFEMATGQRAFHARPDETMHAVDFKPLWEQRADLILFGAPKPGPLGPGKGCVNLRRLCFLLAFASRWFYMRQMKWR